MNNSIHLKFAGVGDNPTANVIHAPHLTAGKTFSFYNTLGTCEVIPQCADKRTSGESIVVAKTPGLIQRASDWHDGNDATASEAVKSLPKRMDPDCRRSTLTDKRYCGSVAVADDRATNKQPSGETKTGVAVPLIFPAAVKGCSGRKPGSTEARPPVTPYHVTGGVVASKASVQHVRRVTLRQ